MGRHIRRERGMSLIELLVAIAILAIALTPLLSLFLHALRASEKAHKMAIANNLARDLAEEIRSQGFWDPTYSEDQIEKEKYYPINTSIQPFGVDTDDGYTVGTARYDALDDVDDYHGWCRGQDCDVFCVAIQAEITAGVVPAGQINLCQDDYFLETYDGGVYNGKGNYPNYPGFTRKVEVFNIYPHVTSIIPEHNIQIGGDSRPFLFYDLRESKFPNLTSDGGVSARGMTRLKVIRVTVEYTGPATPDIQVEDVNLVVLPLSE